jgi:hypothetical protein
MAALGPACSYDFDKFVHDATGGAPAQAGSSHGASGAIGHGGSNGSGGASTAGSAGKVASGGTAGDADGGEAGSTTPTSGGAHGSGAGAGHGGAGSAGKPSTGGQGGTHSTAGSGGTHSTAGSGGTHSTAGSGGTHSTAGTSGTSSGSAGTSSGTCSGTTFGGHCYFVIGEDSGLDWPSAKSACEGYSKTTHLVTITSADEQAAIAKAFFPSTSDTWIGLSLADPSKSPDPLCKLSPDQCPFKWVTGEALDYTDWTMRSSSDNEPNYSGSCVRVPASDETWSDTGCSSKYRAICEDG